jgi:predicted ATPase with chaperone activity
MNTAAEKEHENVKPAFTPKTPGSLENLDIPASLVEDLMLRRLYTQGTGTLKSLSFSLKLPFSLIHTLFQHLRQQQLFEVKGVDGNDYTLTLSGTGREVASKRFAKSSYSGPAPVSIKTYHSAVRAQASRVNLNRSRLKEVLSDLVVTERFLDQLGPALISQTSLFLYGPTGNGKTSVAERLFRIYEDGIVVPYAVEFDGQVIVLYDPAVHQRVETDREGLDPRWVVCRRPCISVGGELEPGMLELKLDENSGVYAAPVQMKANGGILIILIIDDFGRQIISPQYLLNRWIVPLDRRVDYLSLRYGIKFEIPFEMIVVFATNLRPTDLADEAFLRRIRNKIYLEPVDSEVFDQIFTRVVSTRNLSCDPDTAGFLRKQCQELSGGKLRACYPGDILNILISISQYEERPVEITRANLERAVGMYFAKTMTLAQDAQPTSQWSVADERRQIPPSVS